jgi:hypothetical protein
MLVPVKDDVKDDVKDHRVALQDRCRARTPCGGYAYSADGWD